MRVIVPGITLIMGSSISSGQPTGGLWLDGFRWGLLIVMLASRAILPDHINARFIWPLSIFKCRRFDLFLSPAAVTLLTSSLAHQRKVGRAILIIVCPVISLLAANHF